MYTPQHARTNYKALSRFTDVAVERWGEEVMFEGYCDSEVTFQTNGFWFEYTAFKVTYWSHSVIFAMDHDNETVIPIHVEDWLDGTCRDAFVTDTDIPKPRVIVMGDKTLYEIGKKIVVYHLPEEVVYDEDEEL